MSLFLVCLLGEFVCKLVSIVPLLCSDLQLETLTKLPVYSRQVNGSLITGLSNQSHAAFTSHSCQPKPNFTKPSNTCCRVTFFARAEHAFTTSLLEMSSYHIHARAREHTHTHTHIHNYTRNEHPCSQRDSHPRPPQSSCLRPTTQNARPPGSDIVPFGLAQRFPKMFLLADPLQASKNNHRSSQPAHVHTGCFRRNSEYFRRWQYGLFRVNKFI